MAPFAPFEAGPEVAVAVSGGGDSMALSLLMADWTRARSGRALALVVDHGLREESAEEAAQVQSRLENAGLAAEVLAWTGPKPEANRQAEARKARYELMAAHCAERGILHLALAHHREDQAETLLLRLGRGSGLDGLAAMPPVRELPQVRLLRPLLQVPRECLRASLRERGIAWIEDPSNQDTQYSRVRLRNLAPDLAAEGMTPERLTKTAGHLGRARAVLEAEVTALLARSVELHRPDSPGSSKKTWPRRRRKSATGPWLGSSCCSAGPNFRPAGTA